MSALRRPRYGVAFVGVFLSHQLERPFIDGLASVIIGGILVCAAGWLAYESKSLLVGEEAAPELVAAIHAIALDDPAVIGLGAVFTMHLGPEDVLLNLVGTGAPESSEAAPAELPAGVSLPE